MRAPLEAAASIRDGLLWNRWWKIPACSRDFLEQRQNARLARLLQDAHSHVPYYRKMLLELGISPASIRGAEDLRLLPVSEKRVLRQLPPSDLLSSRFRSEQLLRYKTTGSTGVPFEVLKSKPEVRVAMALRGRVLHYFGLRMRDKVLRLTSGTPRPWSWRALEWVGVYPGISASLTEPPQLLAKLIRKERPAVILGNPAVLTMIAQEMAGNGGSLESPPRFVVCGAEVLTPGMRRKLEEVFRCPIYDSYNCVETMHPVAWQCRQTGLYHVSEDALIMEVLKEGEPVGKGEEGEAVITSLVSRAMPIIRHAQGDLVVRGPSPCPCGCPLSTLVSINGRMTDYLFLPGGRQVFASALAYIFHRNADWILQYELVQESLSSIVLRASTLRQPQEAETESLLRDCRGVLGEGVQMRIKLVEGFGPRGAAKFRVLRTALGSPYDGEGPQVEGRGGIR